MKIDTNLDGFISDNIWIVGREREFKLMIRYLETGFHGYAEKFGIIGAPYSGKATFCYEIVRWLKSTGKVCHEYQSGKPVPPDANVVFIIDADRIHEDANILMDSLVHEGFTVLYTSSRDLGVGQTVRLCDYTEPNAICVLRSLTGCDDKTIEMMTETPGAIPRSHFVLRTLCNELASASQSEGDAMMQLLDRRNRQYVASNHIPESDRDYWKSRLGESGRDLWKLSRYDFTFALPSDELSEFKMYGMIEYSGSLMVFTEDASAIARAIWKDLKPEGYIQLMKHNSEIIHKIGAATNAGAYPVNFLKSSIRIAEYVSNMFATKDSEWIRCINDLPEVVQFVLDLIRYRIFDGDVEFSLRYIEKLKSNLARIKEQLDGVRPQVQECLNDSIPEQYRSNVSEVCDFLLYTQDCKFFFDQSKRVEIIQGVKEQVTAGRFSKGGVSKAGCSHTACKTTYTRSMAVLSKDFYNPRSIYVDHMDSLYINLSWAMHELGTRWYNLKSALGLKDFDMMIDVITKAQEIVSSSPLIDIRPITQDVEYSAASMYSELLDHRLFEIDIKSEKDYNSAFNGTGEKLECSYAPPRSIIYSNKTRLRIRWECCGCDAEDPIGRIREWSDIFEDWKEFVKDTGYEKECDGKKRDELMWINIHADLFRYFRLLCETLSDAPNPRYMSGMEDLYNQVEGRFAGLRPVGYWNLVAETTLELCAAELILGKNIRAQIHYAMAQDFQSRSNRRQSVMLKSSFLDVEARLAEADGDYAGAIRKLEELRVLCKENGFRRRYVIAGSHLYRLYALRLSNKANRTISARRLLSELNGYISELDSGDNVGEAQGIVTHMTESKRCGFFMVAQALKSEINATKNIVDESTDEADSIVQGFWNRNSGRDSTFQQ